jgi:hypothetical protein
VSGEVQCDSSAGWRGTRSFAGPAERLRPVDSTPSRRAVLPRVAGSVKAAHGGAHVAASGEPARHLRFTHMCTHRHPASGDHSMVTPNASHQNFPASKLPQVQALSLLLRVGLIQAIRVPPPDCPGALRSCVIDAAGSQLLDTEGSVPAAGANKPLIDISELWTLCPARRPDSGLQAIGLPACAQATAATSRHKQLHAITARACAPLQNMRARV